MLYLNYVQAAIKGVVDALTTAVASVKAVTDVLPDAGALTSIAQEATLGTPVHGSIADDIAAITTTEFVLKKEVTFSNTTGTVNLFTVTGCCQVKLFARCKTSVVSAGGCNAELGIVGGVADFIASTDITKLTAGKIWMDENVTNKAERYFDAVFDYVLGDGQDIILTLSAQADTGDIEFACEYVALSEDGAVAKVV